MPRIQWTDLPPALRDHLFDRLRERKITVEDLYQLKVCNLAHIVIVLLAQSASASHSKMPRHRQVLF